MLEPYVLKGTSTVLRGEGASNRPALPDKSLRLMSGAYLSLKEPIFITDGCFVGLPQHMLDTVKEILEDEDSIRQINEGRAGFKIRTYTSKRAQNVNAVFLSVEFVDME